MGMRNEPDVSGLAELQLLVEQFRDAQVRYAETSDGDADAVAERRMRVLRIALSESALILLPALLETIFGMSVQVAELQRDRDRALSALAAQHAKVVSLEVENRTHARMDDRLGVHDVQIEADRANIATLVERVESIENYIRRLDMEAQSND